MKRYSTKNEHGYIELGSILISMFVVFVITMMLIAIASTVRSSKNEYNIRTAASTQVLLESQGISPTDSKKLLGKEEDKHLFSQGGKGPTEMITLDNKKVEVFLLVHKIDEITEITIRSPKDFSVIKSFGTSKQKEKSAVPPASNDSW